MTNPKTTQNKVPSHGDLLRHVRWRDLVNITPHEGLVECLHPMPWFAASLFLAHRGLYSIALPCTFMFFLTALRLNHEAIHNNLGFGPRGHQIVLHVLSMFMLGSNHSVAWNHLQHHRHVGKPSDLEGKAGRMGLVQVLFYGPMFAWETHRNAWTNGGAVIRRRMMIDGALNLVVPALVLTLASQALAYQLILMVCAQCMTAFFAVWITHHGCEDNLLVARTQRGWLINLISYNMFFHFEHHTFPAIPVKRLPKLAQRLDRAFPLLMARSAMVLPVGIKLPPMRTE